jgi:ribosomal protein L15
VRPGFEGGQTPLKFRKPKISIPPQGHKKMTYTIIKLDMLNEFPENSTVDSKILRDKGLLTRRNKKMKWFKVLGNGNLSVSGLTIRAHAFSKTAREIIESMNGKCVLLSMTRHISKDEIIELAMNFNQTRNLQRDLTEMIPESKRLYEMGTLQLVNRSTKLTRQQLRYVRKFKARALANAEIARHVLSNNTKRLDFLFRDLL